MALIDDLGPGGGGVPFWGLDDNGNSFNEGPVFATDPWDTFWLGKRQIPGECKLDQGTVALIELNKKKGKGLDGAKITLTGYDPQQFSLQVQIATPQQWVELQDIIDIYWTIPGKTRNISQVALSIYHPGLAFLKIYAAVLYGISLPVDGKIEGAKIITFKFQESPNVTVKRNVTKSSGPPAEAGPKPLAASIQNKTPDPPSSVPANASTSGPPLQSVIGAS